MVVWKKLIRMRWQVQVLKALYTASAEFSFNTELRIKAYIGYKNQTQVITHECPGEKQLVDTVDCPVIAGWTSDAKISAQAVLKLVF